MKTLKIVKGDTSRDIYAGGWVEMGVLRHSYRCFYLRQGWKLGPIWG